jgi:hypothetical protein
MNIKVIYDDGCFFCRSLAQFIAKANPNWELIPKSQHSVIQGDQIAVYDQMGQVLYGEAAWEFLMTEDPGLKKLGWLATQIGLSPKIFPKGAQFIHKLCKLCP